MTDVANMNLRRRRPAPVPQRPLFGRRARPAAPANGATGAELGQDVPDAAEESPPDAPTGLRRRLGQRGAAPQEVARHSGTSDAIPRYLLFLFPYIYYSAYTCNASCYRAASGPINFLSYSDEESSGHGSESESDEDDDSQQKVIRGPDGKKIGKKKLRKLQEKAERRSTHEVPFILFMVFRCFSLSYVVRVDFSLERSYSS